MPPFTYCLNTSTVQGDKKLTLPELVDLTAAAGYGAIEPWIGEIEQYVAAGGALADLRKRIEDRGLVVASAIGFAEWVVDDPDQRRKGLEVARHDMELVAALGGRLIAAPPVGHHEKAGLDLFAAAERYAALYDVGQQFGVVPMVEVWGFAKCLNRLGEAAFIAIESGRAGAAILADVYHLRRGGSPQAGLSLLSGSAIQLFHMNDYPASISANVLTDNDRVYPGDGDGPVREIVDRLKGIGAKAFLSLELFNKDYWRQDPLSVAKTGLAKMRAVVE
jgi:2-keto-myo-inositol isomerase